MIENSRYIKPALEHGGSLLKAAKKYAIAVDQWLDLSTGINPWGWPIPDIPAKCWQHLPEKEDGLIGSAAAYYGCRNILPVAGSQAAIQILPELRRRCRVAVPTVGYAEHRQAWEQHGHEVIPLSTKEILDKTPELDVVIIINPNNPTGEMIDKNQLLDLHKRLQEKDGWMIVDEAFMDVTPDQTLSSYCPLPGLFVLRSVGKFFGLAGIRAGFVLAEQAILNSIEHLLGPWTVSGPARWVTKKALADEQWQVTTRQRLERQSARLGRLLEEKLKVPTQGTCLFKTCWLDHATELHEQLAQQGIWVRLLDKQDGLRFGLPESETAFERLEKALLTAIPAAS